MRSSPADPDDDVTKDVERHHIVHKWSVQDEYDPVFVEHARGTHFVDDRGQEYLDGFAQSWYALAGHDAPTIVDAISDQAARLASVHAGEFPTPPRRRLAQRLLGLLPGSFRRVFFGANGSDAVEASLKFSRRGTGRQGVVAFSGSYHGASMAATSVSGLPRCREGFGSPVPGTTFVPYPNCYRCPLGLTYPSCDLQCAGLVEQAIETAGPSSVGAIIGEPVQAVGGVVVPPQPYWTRVREIADKFDLWYISDEIVTAFGRVGAWFAMDHYEAVPDVITLGKGLTSGFMPLSAAVFGDRPDEQIRSLRLQHGMSFEGHPVSCAAALANVDMLDRQGMIASASRLGEQLGEALQDLGTRHPSVGDVRGLGVMWGIELVSDARTKQPPPRERFLSKKHSPIDAAAWAKAELLDRHHVHVGAATDVILVTPPLTFTVDDITELVTALDAVLEDVDQRCA